MMSHDKSMWRGYIEATERALREERSETEEKTTDVKKLRKVNSKQQETSNLRLKKPCATVRRSSPLLNPDSSVKPAFIRFALSQFPTKAVPAGYSHLRRNTFRVKQLRLFSRSRQWRRNDLVRISVVIYLLTYSYLYHMQALREPFFSSRNLRTSTRREC